MTSPIGSGGRRPRAGPGPSRRFASRSRSGGRWPPRSAQAGRGGDIVSVGVEDLLLRRRRGPRPTPQPGVLREPRAIASFGAQPGLPGPVGQARRDATYWARRFRSFRGHLVLMTSRPILGSQVQTLIASTIGATSWTRTTCAPPRTPPATKRPMRPSGRQPTAGQRSQQPFARRADQDRTTQRGKLMQVPQDLQVMLDRLAEADPRVDGDAMRVIPSVRPGRCAGPGNLHLPDDVVIPRVVLPSWGAGLVHDHDARTVRRRGGAGRGLPQVRRCR